MKFKVNRTSGKWVGYQKNEIVLELKSLEDLTLIFDHFKVDELVIGKCSTRLNNNSLEISSRDKDVKYFIEVYDDYRE